MSPRSNLPVAAGYARCPLNGVVTVLCVEGFSVVLKLPEIRAVGNTAPPDILDDSGVAVRS